MPGSTDPPQPQYLFLAGTGRSGTTVLRKSLGQHPDIYYNGHENNIVQDVVDVARMNCELPSRKFAMVVDEDEYARAFRELLDRIIWNDSQQRAKPVWMAAINPNEETLGFLLRIFPSAKVIGLIRNGIDVTLSRQNYPSFQNQPFATHCRTWLRSKWVFDWGAANPASFRCFRQEWLRNPETVDDRFRELFRWLNLTDSHLPWQHAQNHRYHPSPPNQLSAGRPGWSSWSNEQQQLFVDLCGSQMERFGYTIPFAKTKAA